MMAKAKRLRAPVIHADELRIYWGREGRGQAPEVMFGCGKNMVKNLSVLNLKNTYRQQKVSVLK